MATMTRRLQILLDEQRYARLERQAEQRGTSVATVVRDALDGAFPSDRPNRVEAAQRLLDAEPIPVGDWSEMKTEIEEMYEPGAAG